MTTSDDRLLNRDWTQPVRYPDPAVEVLDSRFRQYVLASSALERIWTGARWTEGPVWFGDLRSLIWSDIPNDRLLRWCEETGSVSLFRQPSNYANGNTRDRQGRLITCEHGTRRVTRTEHDGTLTVLMDSFQGRRLNAPNDVVVHPDGGIWFTDPGYGIHWNYEGHKAEFELDTCVYRIDPESLAATMVCDELVKPNGLGFSPDYRLLYIADTGASHKPGHPRQICVYDVVDGVRLTGRRQFCELSPAGPDGFRLDMDGNLWSAAGWAGAGHDGVQVFAPDGEKIGAIHLPEGVSNVCFGGVKRNRLFMTAGQSVYSLYVETQGVPYV
jgi:gluconolactonase